MKQQQQQHRNSQRLFLFLALQGFSLLPDAPHSPFTSTLGPLTPAFRHLTNLQAKHAIQQTFFLSCGDTVIWQCRLSESKSIGFLCSRLWAENLLLFTKDTSPKLGPLVTHDILKS